MNTSSGPEKKTRLISKRGYVYIGRAYAGQNVKVTIIPEISAELKKRDLKNLN